MKIILIILVLVFLKFLILRNFIQRRLNFIMIIHRVPNIFSFGILIIAFGNISNYICLLLLQIIIYGRKRF